jgi:hypothetical protein
MIKENDVANTISDYYHADDGATGIITQARKAVAELPLERILGDREASERDIMRRYELPLIVFEGEAVTSVEDGASGPSIMVKQPVKPDDKIAEVLRRIDEPWVSSPYRLDYSEGYISYKIRAGEPFFVKEEVRHSLEAVKRQEIEPRNSAVARENERLKQAIAQAFEDRYMETSALSERKRQIEEALNH